VGQTNLAAATNNYWQITGVQLETGPVATPFEFEPYEATLRKCQRYYQKLTRSEAPTTGQCFGTATAGAALLFEKTMRAAPTITLAAAGSSAGQIAFLSSIGGYPATIGSHTADGITAQGFRVYGSGYTSAFTAGNATMLYPNGSTDIYTASAEL
jgi:hypothetical protein